MNKLTDETIEYIIEMFPNEAERNQIIKELEKQKDRSSNKPTISARKKNNRCKNRISKQSRARNR